MNAYFKDILREIKKSAGRFISLLIITALGAASVVGIQATSINMRGSADKYYKAHNLYDLQIKSTVGFSEDDINALRETRGVRIVMPTYIYDVFIYFGNDTRTVRTYALPGELNKLEIVEGRLPENAGEVVVEHRLLRHGRYNIGDIINLGLYNMQDYDNIFNRREFTIVGITQSPLYINLHDRGNTALGDGRLNFFLYLHPDAYNLEVYTDLYILLEDSQEIDNLTDYYYEFLQEWKEHVQQTGNIRTQDMINELADNQSEISDNIIELEKARIELIGLRNTLRDILEQFGENEQVSDLYEELNAQDREILDGLHKLQDARRKLNNAPTPEWFYFTRKDEIAFDSYYQDTLRLEQIGYVFPLVYFLGDISE